MRFTLLLLYFFVISSALKKDTDLISDLPGLTYNLNFKQYSGYLLATPGNNLHYWLVESQISPETAPLVLWLNGGPGCSSLDGLLTELGPFHPNPDGTTLFENIYSWNKGANVLFLEAPRGIGFSYQDGDVNNDTTFNDDMTAWDNFLALKDFFANYPEYQKRDFYVMGESYSGVYVPTLTRTLIQQIQAGNLTANLVGIAVGNGELNEYLQINSIIHLMYAHGVYGKSEFDALMKCCPTTLMYCDFSQYIYLEPYGVVVAKDNTSECDLLVEQLGFYGVFYTRNDVYNLYQDCYQSENDPLAKNEFNTASGQYRAASSFIDQGSVINWASTDAFGAFPCYMEEMTEKYLNQPAVRSALNIPTFVPYWTDCNRDIEYNYIQQNQNTTQVFDDIIASNYKLRILIYNGDVDTACNFLGDEWFIEALAEKYNMTTTHHRHPWLFTPSTIAGYRKAFSFRNINIDLVTVKGAGHFVPTDRPGPALQMITNFIKNTGNYSLPTGYDVTRTPLLPAYLPDLPKYSAVSMTTNAFVSLAKIIGEILNKAIS